MPLKLYNSYTKRKEVFRPRKGKRVTMYNCGPTVYDYVHIGNLRSFLFADVLRRYLEYRGYKVKQIMNITDVGHMTTDADSGEDKMSVAAKREGKGPIEVARFYEEKFMEDVKVLGVIPAAKYPRASEHIAEMIVLIKKLLKRGHAYFVKEDGGSSVYYDLSTFLGYGKLSGNVVDDLIAGARVDVIAEKRNPYDFALWIYKPTHVLQWSAPWGAGYPGWHLECSAMSMKYLGTTLDIHTGGEDNKFPHHECEIAQSEGASGKPFVRMWLHVKYLLVDGKKMSKSLGNFYTLKDLLQKGFSARAVRYLLISAHYRDTFNFTLEGLKAAESALKRVDELVEKLHNPPSPVLRTPSPRGRGKGEGDGGVMKLVAKARKNFIAALDDDLNVSKALGVLFEFARALNGSMNDESTALAGQAGIRRSDRRAAMGLLGEIDCVFGFGIGESTKTAIPAEVMEIVAQREAARKVKDWAKADELRAQIEMRGYIVKDTPEGAQLKAIEGLKIKEPPAR